MTLKAVMNGGGGGGQKTVLITGVSRGLGKALAIELAKRGHFVIGCSRSQPASLQSQLSSSSTGQEHLFLTADVSSNSSVQELARTVMEKKGVPDIIVNNAGTINKNNRLWEVPEEEFNTVIDTNIKGIANMLRHFIPLMIEKKQGVIVNMSSGWGRSAAAQVAPYCASKWAVEGLTKSVAKEVPSGMAIVALIPGVINTDMLASCFGSSSSLYQAPDSWAPKAADMILNLTMADNGSSLSRTKLKEARQSAGSFVGEVAKDAKGNVSKVAERVGSVVKSRWSLFQQPSTRQAMQERLVSAAATTSFFLRRGVSETKEKVVVGKSKVEEVAKKTTQKSKTLLTDIELWQKVVASTDVFGVPLEVTVQRQDSTKPVPFLLVKCADFLILSGLNSPDLFKSEGNKKVIQQLT